MIRTVCSLIVAVSVVAADTKVLPESCLDYYPECPRNENDNSPTTHLPYYENCHKFYKCDHGRACLFSCPYYNNSTIQLVFNPDKQVCDHPGNVPGLPNCPNAPGTTLPTTSPPPITSPPITLPPITYPPPTASPPITYPPPTASPPITYPPPTASPPITYPPASSTTPGGSIPANCLNECPDSGRARVRHATKCKFYYDCVGGKYVLRKCIDNSYFNCYVQTCDRLTNLPANYLCTDLEVLP